METKFTSIIDDVLKDFPPGGRFLLSYLSDFELNEWRSGCFVSFSLAGCLFIPTVAHERGMCRHTSNYDKMIFSRLDEIEALDADDIIKRMHVNDLMENTGDDLRNNYQGQYLDGETGLAYNRFRYYSPETGAYISQDPIRLEAGLTNLYAYVHDVNAWVDPWGLDAYGVNQDVYALYKKTDVVNGVPIDGAKPYYIGISQNAELRLGQHTASGGVDPQIDVKVDLHKNIDYATATANTTYGSLGIKVWIFNGEVLPTKKEGGNE